jgi:hypothetical protein
LHVEATGSTSSYSVHADTQALTVVDLAIGVSFLLQQTRMARRKSLCTVTDDLEDVDREAVGGVVELFVEALAHILLLDWLVDKRRDDGLRVPVGKTMHDCSEFFIRVDGSIASFLVLEWSVGVNRGLCLKGQ